MKCPGRGSTTRAEHLMERGDPAISHSADYAGRQAGPVPGRAGRACPLPGWPAYRQHKPPVHRLAVYILAGSAAASALCRAFPLAHQRVDRHHGPKPFPKTASPARFPPYRLFSGQPPPCRAADGTARSRSSGGCHPVSSNSPRCGGARHGGRRLASDSGAFASRWVRIFSITSGSSMQAMIRIAPPQV